MKIIAFLGNPGKKYARNRHNAGFIFGNFLARELGLRISQKQFSSFVGRSKIDGIDTLLLFPETYMNKSGHAVNEALAFYKETPGSLIVAHDEIELPFGEIRTKFSGGHKGQNGIRSIMTEIGTPDFHRIRIGVGRPVNTNIPVADHVLSNFSKDEFNLLEEKYTLFHDALKSLLPEE